MKKYSFDNLKSLDEIFLFEYTRCQSRAAYGWKRTATSVMDPDNPGKHKKVMTRLYAPDGESFKYIVKKKFFFKIVGELFKGKKIDMQYLKALSMEIANLERRKTNRSVPKNTKYLDRLVREAVEDCVQMFYLIQLSDFENEIRNLISAEINLQDLIEERLKKVGKMYKMRLPEVEWNGCPRYTVEYACISKKGEKAVKLVILTNTGLENAYIHEDLHVALCVKAYLMYVQKDEEFLKSCGGKRLMLDEIIVYDLVDCKRYEYGFEDFHAKFHEGKMMKILSVLQNNLHIKANYGTACKYCEQKNLCSAKSTSSSKLAYEKVNKIKENKLLI